jgi:cytochrome P450
MSVTTSARERSGAAGRIFAEASAWADFDGWHAAARELREAAPLLRVELPGRDPFWAVLRHDEVMDVERRNDVFSNAPIPTIVPRRPEPGEGPTAANTALIMLDGEEHRIRRAILSDWFKPRHIRDFGDAVRDLATRAVDDMAKLGGECDFAQDIANQFPLRVILSMLGLPEDDFGRMLRLTQELFGADDPDFARVAEDDQMLAVIMDFFAYFSGVTADRRDNPRDDLASIVAHAELKGAPVDDMEAFAFYLIVATAGHDTTSSAIAGGMWALLRYPEQLERLRAHPELIDTAVDEIIRWVSPVKHFMRTAVTATEVGGVPIAANDWLLLSYASANRDELVFEDPDRFDVGRANAARHLAFGFGAHYCLGTHLAKLEIKSFLQELLARVDDIELTGDVSFVESTLVSGPKHLPIRYQVVK